MSNTVSHLAGLLILRGLWGKSARFSCGIKHMGGLLVLRGHEQDSTEMAKEIGPHYAARGLGDIPRQLQEGRREHQRQDHGQGFVGFGCGRRRWMRCAMKFTARRTTDLPGYFRASKDWDLLAVADGTLLAVVELKSQVGSFGDIVNNRMDEAIGNATDLWTAYREGAFKSSLRPWLGYFMMLEDAPGSTRPVGVRERHFTAFKEFERTSYADRYALLCKRLVLERLYDAACLILSSRETGPNGDYREPDPQLSFKLFATSLVAHSITFARLRS